MVKRLYTGINDEILNRACQAGHKDIVELLFKAGADGMTASCSCLIAAINGGHIEVVQCILNSVPELIQVSFIYSNTVFKYCKQISEHFLSPKIDDCNVLCFSVFHIRIIQ